MKLCKFCTATLDPRNSIATCVRCRRSHPDAIAEHQAKRIATLNAQTAEMRLSRFQVKAADENCWGWRGAHNGVGYGVVTFRGRVRLATHLSLENDGRPRPSTAHVACHTCDNPACTNPAHLWWGTEQQNMRDAASKGRLQGWSRQKGAKKVEVL